MSVQYRGRLTEDDWRAACALIRKVSNQSDPRSLAVGWWLLALLALFVGMAVPEYRIASAVLLGICIGLGWWTRGADRRSWRRDPRNAEEQWGELSDESLTVSTALATSTLAWAAVARHASTPALFVLEFRGSQFVAFPRHFFASDDEWRSAIAVLSSVTSRASTLFTNLPPHVSRMRWLLQQVGLWLAILVGLILLMRAAA